MNKNWGNTGLYILIVLVLIAFASAFFTSSTTVKELNFSQFMQEVEANNVKEITIEGSSVKGTLMDNKTKIHAYVPAEDVTIYKTLRDHKIDVTVVPVNRSNWWVSLLTILLPILVIGVFWFLMMRQAQSGGNQALSFGKSRAKMMTENTLKVTFADVAGVDEAKQELQEVVEFLKSPEKFQALGAKIPKGVLLVGSPGTGKTLLAKAVAGEAGVPFFSISGSDFVEMFVGVGASRVRSLFEQAKKASPCIVFVDEIDAVGRQRGAGLGGGHDEREQTLNQLLVEMDGFEANQSIIIIAATNRPDILDPALLRPGRFDRQVVVDRPDINGRKQILTVHAKGKPLASNVNMEVIARRTPGFTGADLANLINEAALLAARRNSKEIFQEDIENSIDKVMAGSERKSRIISDREKEIVAYHELGHAVVAKLLKNTDPVHKVTIIPRGMALGYTLQLPTEDKYLTSKAEIEDRLAVMLGGRVAEEIVFNEITTGAQNDLERASEMARRMVTEFGMSSNLGPITFGRRSGEVFLGRSFGEERNYSDSTAQAIDKEVKSIIEKAYTVAKDILTTQKENLKMISKVLMERETIDGEELDSLLKGIIPPSSTPAAAA